MTGNVEMLREQLQAEVQRCAAAVERAREMEGEVERLRAEQERRADEWLDAEGTLREKWAAAKAEVANLQATNEALITYVKHAAALEAETVRLRAMVDRLQSDWAEQAQAATDTVQEWQAEVEGLEAENERLRAEVAKADVLHAVVEAAKAFKRISDTWDEHAAITGQMPPVEVKRAYDDGRAALFDAVDQLDVSGSIGGGAQGAAPEGDPLEPENPVVLGETDPTPRRRSGEGFYKRPPAISDQARQERAEARNRGVLNEAGAAPEDEVGAIAGHTCPTCGHFQPIGDVAPEAGATPEDADD